MGVEKQSPILGSKVASILQQLDNSISSILPKIELIGIFAIITLNIDEMILNEILKECQVKSEQSYTCLCLELGILIKEIKTIVQKYDIELHALQKKIKEIEMMKVVLKS